ncbi:Bracovirus particle protein [Microplitis demolitor]|nr:Bracovirus particle protein [Microplitis demolitor]
MKHLLQLLENTSLEFNNELYDTFLLLSNYDTSFVTAVDMKFLMTSVFENITLYKIFIHIENITAIANDDELLTKIDTLILNSFGENELCKLKITSMNKLNSINSLISLLLTIPIYTFTINITNAKSISENNLQNNLPISTQKMLLKNQTLFNANDEINKSYRCHNKINSIDIYVGPPVYYDDFTNSLCLLLNIPSNKLWQPSYNSDGYKTQMVIVNELNIINAELNNWDLSEVIESAMNQQILGVHNIKNIIDDALQILNYDQQSNDETDYDNYEEDTSLDNYSTDNENNPSSENFDVNDNISDELNNKLQHILLINDTIQSEKSSLTLNKLDDVVLKALSTEIKNLELDIVNNPLSSLLNSSLPSDIEICNNLNRQTVKSIFMSYSNFKNNMPLLQMNTIACPLIYKQFLAIFPFYDGNIINILKCNEVSELQCDGSYDVLSFKPHPAYNPSYISNAVIKKLKLLISFLEFDGNYTTFENVINLIPFDIDDLPSIMSIMLSMTNMVYVTVCTAIYTYHLSIFKHYHVQSMYRLTCILGPDAFKLMLNNSINLPLIKKQTSKLHLLSIKALFPTQLHLADVSLDEFDDDIVYDDNVNKYKLNKHFSKIYPEYVIWLYLLSLSNLNKVRDNKVIKRENYLLMMLRNIVENPNELYYIKNKLYHNISELNAKLSINDIYESMDFNNDNLDGEINLTDLSSLDEIEEATIDRVNYQPEQHNIDIIYQYLIKNNCSLQNDIWGLLHYMLRSKNIDKYIDCIQCYAQDL